MKKVNLIKEEIIDLYCNKDLSSRKIAKIYGVDKTTICSLLKKNNIVLRSKEEEYKKNSQTKLTEQQKIFLIGTMLGDGCIVLGRSKRSARFSVSHCRKQLNYLKYKKEILNNISKEIKYHKIFNNKVQKEYEFFDFFTKYIPDLIEFRNLFYYNNRKIVSDELIKCFNSPQSLAIWIMDDGTLYKKRLRLCTDCFSYDEHVILQKILLNNFGIKSSITKYTDKYFRLLFGVKETKKISKIVFPYIIDDMKYKIILDC